MNYDELVEGLARKHSITIKSSNRETDPNGAICWHEIVVILNDDQIAKVNSQRESFEALLENAVVNAKLRVASLPGGAPEVTIIGDGKQLKVRASTLLIIENFFDQIFK